MIKWYIIRRIFKDILFHIRSHFTESYDNYNCYNNEHQINIWCQFGNNYENINKDSIKWSKIHHLRKISKLLIYQYHKIRLRIAKSTEGILVARFSKIEIKWKLSE